MQKHRQGKTPFKSAKIRELSELEKEIFQKITDVIEGREKECVITFTPGFVSKDGRARPLILSSAIALKIMKDHGDFLIENFIVNAVDWDFVKLNVQGDPDRINLVKRIGETEGFLRIAAVRVNGYFILTHYENVERDSQPLKNFLAKGNVLDRSGGTRAPTETGYSSFATPHE